MNSGQALREVRLSEDSGVLRVICVAKFAEAVYVLHCFQKKARTTSKPDKSITEARYRAVAAGRKNQK